MNNSTPSKSYYKNIVLTQIRDKNNELLFGAKLNGFEIFPTLYEEIIIRKHAIIAKKYSTITHSYEIYIYNILKMHIIENTFSKVTFLSNSLFSGEIIPYKNNCKFPLLLNDELNDKNIKAIFSLKENDDIPIMLINDLEQISKNVFYIEKSDFTKFLYKLKNDKLTQIIERSSNDYKILNEYNLIAAYEFNFTNKTYLIDFEGNIVDSLPYNSLEAFGNNYLLASFFDEEGSPIFNIINIKGNVIYNNGIYDYSFLDKEHTKISALTADDKFIHIEAKNNQLSVEYVNEKNVSNNYT